VSLLIFNRSDNSLIDKPNLATYKSVDFVVHDGGGIYMFLLSNVYRTYDFLLQFCRQRYGAE
jgi:hypothetical protein